MYIDLKNMVVRFDVRLLVTLFMFLNINVFGQYSPLLFQGIVGGAIPKEIQTTSDKTYFYDGQALEITADSYVNGRHTETVTFTIKNNINSRIKVFADIQITWACGKSSKESKVFELPPMKKIKFDQEYMQNLYIKEECIRNVGNGITTVGSISHVNMRIVDLDASAREYKKQEEEKEKKRLAEIEAQKKAYAEAEAKRIADAEAKKKAEELAKAKIQNANSANNSANQSSTVNKSTATQSTAQNQQGINTEKLPELFKTTDGRYYRKVGDNLTQLDYDQYMAIKHQNAVQQQKVVDDAAKVRAVENQQKVNEILNKQNATRLQEEKATIDFNNRLNQLSQNFESGRRVNALKEELKENSTLSGNYDSLDQLENEFNQKMASLNNVISNLTAQKNESLNSSVNLYFNDSQSQTYGEGLKLLGGMVNDISAANAKKKAEQQLREQREAATLAIENKKREQLYKFRTDLLSKFTNGSLPLSSSRISAQTIYYFVYAYNKPELGNDQPVLFVSNVFPIMQYADGTWPFKDKIMGEINGLTTYSEMLDGHHIDKSQAASRRDFLINKFKQSGGLIREVNYKGKMVSDSKTDDFWGNKKKTDSTEPNAPKKTADDFWSK